MNGGRKTAGVHKDVPVQWCRQEEEVQEDRDVQATDNWHITDMDGGQKWTIHILLNGIFLY